MQTLEPCLCKLSQQLDSMKFPKGELLARGFTKYLLSTPCADKYFLCNRHLNSPGPFCLFIHGLDRILRKKVVLLETIIGMSVHFFLSHGMLVSLKHLFFYVFFIIIILHKEVALPQERKVSLSKNRKWIKNSRQVHNSCTCQ